MSEHKNVVSDMYSTANKALRILLYALEVAIEDPTPQHLDDYKIASAASQAIETAVNKRMELLFRFSDVNNSDNQVGSVLCNQDGQ